MLSIALKGMWAHKRRLLRTCSAVLLGVAFLAGTLVLGDTMRAGFSQVFADAYSKTNVVVEASKSIGTDQQQKRLIPESVLGPIQDLDKVEAAIPSIDGTAQVVGKDGEPIGGDGPPTLGGAWVVDDPTNPYQIVDGRAPDAHDEVVIDRGTATAGDLGVGDTTSIRTPTPVQAKIVGIVAFGSQDSIGGSGFTGFTPDDAREYLLGGASGYSGISVKAANGVSDEALADSIQPLLPDGFSARTAAQMQARAEESIGKDFLNAFEIFLLVFTGVALLVATFSIYNTFSVILAQRSRESALFRAIGATRSQVLGSIGVEAAAVGLVASIGGFLVGLLLAVGLTALMRNFGVDLPGSLELQPTSIIVSVVVGLLVTLLASLVPAIRASRVLPMAALRDAAIDRSDTSRSRAIVGSSLAAVGVALVLAGALGSLKSASSVVGIGAVLSVIAVVVLGPVVARPASRILGSPIATFRGAPGELAVGNAMRNPTRTAGTASALMIGVAVVVLFTVVGSSLTSMVRDVLTGSVRAELLLVETGFSGNGMSPKLADELSQIPGVSKSVGLGFGTVLIGSKETNVTVADPSQIELVLDNEVLKGSFNSLGDDHVAVSDSEAEKHGWSMGTSIDVGFIDGTTMPMEVGAIYKRAELTGSIVLPRETWRAHSTFDVDLVNMVALDDGADIGQVRKAIDKVGQKFGAPEAQTRNEYADEAAGQITQLLGIVYVLLALSIIIALMGITNTLALSIHERTRELGLLRAIGQTRAQMRSMVRWESVIIAVFGTVGGVGLGLFLAWGMVRSLASEGLSGFSAPIGQLVVITLIGGIAGVLAAIRPARRAAKLDVLEAIASE
ncbi:MAG: FtsX-like permease family protein [Microthrixaceae bacterium]